MMVVTLKYVMLILRADNNGEGIMALTALAAKLLEARTANVSSKLLLHLVLPLFYGDSVINPAMSIFSAVEGL